MIDSYNEGFCVLMYSEHDSNDKHGFPSHKMFSEHAYIEKKTVFSSKHLFVVMTFHNGGIRIEFLWFLTNNLLNLLTYTCFFKFFPLYLLSILYLTQ